MLLLKNISYRDRYSISNKYTVKRLVSDFILLFYLIEVVKGSVIVKPILCKGLSVEIIIPHWWKTLEIIKLVGNAIQNIFPLDKIFQMKTEMSLLLKFDKVASFVGDLFTVCIIRDSVYQTVSHLLQAKKVMWLILKRTSIWDKYSKTG